MRLLYFIHYQHNHYYCIDTESGRAFYVEQDSPEQRRGSTNRELLKTLRSLDRVYKPILACKLRRVFGYPVLKPEL